MATESSSVKQVTLANAKQAAGGAPPVVCGPGCKPCRRVDLQLLVTLPSLAPTEHGRAIKDSGYAWAPVLHPGYGKVTRKATLPVARIARKGYIMVYFIDRKCWDVWQVVDCGLTVKKMHQVSTAQYTQLQSGMVKNPDSTPVCSRMAANLVAQMICIEGATSVRAVWIAFTDYLWSPATLARYAADTAVEVSGADGKTIKTRLQATRGREISPQQILKGTVPEGALALNTENLQQHLVDFVKLAPASFKKGFTHALQRLDAARTGKAADFAAQVRAIERASGTKNDPELYVEKSIFLLVPDPIGVADLHNQLRATALADRFAWEGGGPDLAGKNADPARPWKRQSLLHAAYIRGRVRQQAVNNEMDRLGRDGLSIDNSAISAERYKQIKALEAQGTNVHPRGTRYEPFDQGRAYRVIYPEEYVSKKVEEQANSAAETRIARYNKHLDWAAIDKYNLAWLAQEKVWLELLAERDADYVAWMNDPEFKLAIQYDFDEGSAISKEEKRKDELERDLQDIAARLMATARCYGSGALADASLEFLSHEFAKASNDPSHHVAAALVKPFSIFDKALEDASTQADGWDAVLAAKDVRGEFKDVWDQVSQPATAAASMLNLTANQVIDKMRAIALLPAIAGNKGLKLALKDVELKKVVWARAAGLHHYLATGNQIYFIKVKWSANAFAAAAAEPTLDKMALDLGTFIKKKKRAAARAKSLNGLRSSIATGAANVEVTVPLVIDETQLRKIAAKHGEPMVEVVGSSLFGTPQGKVSLPESLAKAIVMEQTNFSPGKLKSWSAGFSSSVLILQSFAARSAFEDMHKKGGYDQIDAVASLVSSVTGIAGALLELSVLTMAPSAHAAMPFATEFAAKVPWYLRAKYAAGLFASAGAAFDAAAAFAKHHGRHAQGDFDAADAYFNSTILQGTSAVSLAGGAFYAHRAALLQRLGGELALRALASSFSPLVLARTLTGIGLVLWLAGLGYSIYATYMEDDVNEVYLRRSAFGTGHPQLGPFVSLDHEMNAFLALSIGVMAELEWNDEVFSADELTATVRVIKPDPTDILAVVIEGFAAINENRLVEIYRGVMPALGRDPGDKDGVVYLSQKTMKIPSGVKAVRMTYFLHKADRSGTRSVARNELWIED